MSRRPAYGFSLIELTAALAIAGLLLAGLYTLVIQTSAMRTSSERVNDTVLEMQFALDRMVHGAQESRRILLPLDGVARDVFAVTLPASVDRDGNGVADADIAE